MSTGAAATPVDGRLPIGVCLRSIGTEPAWWLESARRLDAAGYAGLWCWDHLEGKRDMTVPVVEAWTALSMAAATTLHAAIGPFVLNVMNRHPALVARMASTLQIASGGRVILGIGIGGAEQEHRAYGIDFPAAPERVERLEEAVAVMRALWTGGAGDAAVRLLSASGRRCPPGAGPTTPDPHRRRDGDRRAPGGSDRRWLERLENNFEANLPRYLEALEAAGRRREEQLVLAGFQGGDWLGDGSFRDSPWFHDPRGSWDHLKDVGADGAIVLARTTDDVDAMVEAVDRW